MFKKRTSGTDRGGMGGPAARADGSWWQMPTLCPEGFRKVVGESYYQDAIARAVNRWGVREVIAQLVPEPSNKFDRNAIRVCIDGETIGYIPREDLPDFHFMFAEMEGRPATSRASVTGGVAGKAHYGVVLNCSPEVFPEEFGFLFGRKSYAVSVPKAKVADVLDLVPTGSTAQVQLVIVDKSVVVEVGGAQIGKLSKSVSEDYQLVVEGTSAAGIVPATVLESTLNSSSGAPKFVVRLPEEPTRWAAVCRRRIAEHARSEAPAIMLPTEEPEVTSSPQSSAEAAPESHVAQTTELTHAAADDQIEAGWHPDPRGEAELRWWDGSSWTDQTHHRSVREDDPSSRGTGAAEPATGAPSDAPAAGWFTDPYGRFEQRYWDGTGWTNSVLVDGQSIIEPGT